MDKGFIWHRAMPMPLGIAAFLEAYEDCPHVRISGTPSSASERPSPHILSASMFFNVSWVAGKWMIVIYRFTDLSYLP
jgi:hypothetical protein